MKFFWLLLMMTLSFSSYAADIIVRIDTSPSIDIKFNELETKLSQITIKTNLPWAVGVQSYTGFSLRDVVELIHDGEFTSVTFIAENNYISNVTYEEVVAFTPLLAFLTNKKAITVNNGKQSSSLIFNLNQYPEINHAHFHYKMTFWIKEIVINTTK